MIPVTLLSTKLYIPPPRPDLVPRPRLLERLNASLGHNGDFKHHLILLSAPAGFGKTTLLSAWVAELKAQDHQLANSIAWLTLEENDNDLVRWLSYLIAALQTINPELGRTSASMLLLPQTPQADAILAPLINQLAASQGKYILILDDYHLIEAQSIHHSLIFLLDHLPGNFLLVISTRADPPVQLARLRARRQLNELREHDLRFTDTEVAELLNQVMGLDLSPEDINALDNRTEGWIAGLQLAALSMQDQPDKHRFVQSFSGSNRYILDYLGQEVLNQQTTAVQKFLLQTSILDRLTAPLCDFIMRDPGEGMTADQPLPELDSLDPSSASQQILEDLETTNLFVIPLDQGRTWYRYHQLFADLLRKRLQQVHPELLPFLHRRASDWFARNGFPSQAITHAIAANDFDRAADLIEQVAEITLMHSQVNIFLSWVHALPEEVIRNRPLLSIFQAGAMLISGHPLASVESLLSIAEQTDTDGSFAGELTAFRAMSAAIQGNNRLSIELSHQALELLPADRLFLRSMIFDNLGMTHLLHGEIDAAIHYFNEAARAGQQTGNIMSAVGALANLAGLLMLQGQLQRAETTYQQALAYATDEAGGRLPIAGKALLGLGELAREWNDLEAARRYFTDAVNLLSQYGDIGPIIAYISLARLEQAKGDLKAAHDYLQEARRLAVRFDATEMDDQLVDNCEAWLWLVEGRLAAVEDWAAQHGLHELASSEKAGAYLDIHEIELSTLARLYLAQERIEEALELLERLLQAARETGRVRSVIRLTVQQALAYHARDDEEQAITILAQALSLAESENFIRTFLDEGEPLVHLLYLALEDGIMPDYTKRLLAEYQGLQGTPSSGSLPTTSAASYPPGTLIEPLSAREIEVLQLLADGLTNRQIANKLVISLSTVKGHTAKIYNKLSVNNRTQAVARGRVLGLLT